MKTASRRTLFVIGVILVVVAATIYGFLPKAVEVDLVAVSRGPLQVTIEEEGTHPPEGTVCHLGADRRVPAADRGKGGRSGAKGADRGSAGAAAVAGPRSPKPRGGRGDRLRGSGRACRGDRKGERRRRPMPTTSRSGWTGSRISSRKDTSRKISSTRRQSEAEEGAGGSGSSAKAAVDVAARRARSGQKTLQNFSAPVEMAGRRRPCTSPPRSAAPCSRIYRESEGPSRPGEPLLEIGNAKNLEVRVEVLSSDAVKIAKGTPVLFKRWGGEGTLTGIVRLVEPAGFTKVSSLGVEEQRVLVIADITCTPGTVARLGDGYRLEAHFVIWEGKDVLQIPAERPFPLGKGVGRVCRGERQGAPAQGGGRPAKRPDGGDHLRPEGGGKGDRPSR